MCVSSLLLRHTSVCRQRCCTLVDAAPSMFLNWRTSVWVAVRRGSFIWDYVTPHTARATQPSVNARKRSPMHSGYPSVSPHSRNHCTRAPHSCDASSSKRFFLNDTGGCCIEPMILTTLSPLYQHSMELPHHDVVRTSAPCCPCCCVLPHATLTGRGKWPLLWRAVARSS